MNLLFSLPGGSEVMLLLSVALFSFEVSYLVSLQNFLRTIHPANRLMPPGTVWVVLVPYVSALFHFIVVFKLSGSIITEAASRGMQLTEKRPGLMIGLLMLICHCLTYIPIPSLPAAGLFVTCHIIFLIRMNRYKKLFATTYIGS